MVNNEKPERLTMDANEAAVKLGISLPSLYKAIKNGEVPVIRLGHRVLIPISALESHLAAAGNKS